MVMFPLPRMNRNSLCIFCGFSSHISQPREVIFGLSEEQHPQSCSKESTAPCRDFPAHHRSGGQSSGQLTPRQHLPQSHLMQQELSETSVQWELPLDPGPSLGVRTGATITQCSGTKQASDLVLGQIPLLENNFLPPFH